ELLGTALVDVVARHEPLRMIVRDLKDDIVGVLLPAPSAEALLAVEDLSALEDEDRARAVAERLAAEPGLRFDLAHDYSLRARLLRLGVEEHVLVLSLHHAAA